MQLTQSITDLVSSQSVKDDEHILIVSDRRTSRKGYCFFNTSGFKHIEMDGIHQYFDESLRLLMQSSTRVLTSADLPILHAVGTWRTTVVERERDGSIAVYDASATPVDAHIGLG